MSQDRRGLLARAFDVCVGIFIAALLLHFAVVLIADVFWWLVSGAAVALGGAAVWMLIRARNGRW